MFYLFMQKLFSKPSLSLLWFVRPRNLADKFDELSDELRPGIVKTGKIPITSSLTVILTTETHGLQFTHMLGTRERNHLRSRSVPLLF